MKIDLERVYKDYPKDFRTHLNYVSCLNMLSKGLKVKCNLKIKRKIPRTKILEKKIGLIKLTLKSLEGEYKIIQKNPDYAELCVSWVSVKSYYLLFNLFLIIEFLVSGNESCFDLSHRKLLDNIKKLIGDGVLVFNKDFFNKIYPVKKVLGYKFKSGANLKIINVDYEKRFHQILKKLVRYKLEEFQRQEKIKDFKKKRNRKKKDEFLSCSTINILEFFYWYRIKANYRDLEFLGKKVSENDFKDFYLNYFNLTLLLCKCILDLIEPLLKKRLK